MTEEKIQELAGFLSTYVWYEERHPEELIPLAEHIAQWFETNKESPEVEMRLPNGKFE